MIRYYDFYEKKLCVAIRIPNGSSDTPSVPDLEKAFKTKMREISEDEYKKLDEEYGKAYDERKGLGG